MSDQGLQSSGYYAGQLQSMGQAPDFKSQIAAAYQNPVIKPLTQEAGNLESQYLPTIFNTFASMGTGAADMSPAAKLAMVGGALGRLGGNITANNDVQNYYGNQVNQLAQTAAQNWQNQQQQWKDMYNMAFQKEQADRANQLAQQQLAASRAAAARASTPMAFPAFNGPQQPQPQQAQQIFPGLFGAMSGAGAGMGNPGMFGSMPQQSQLNSYDIANILAHPQGSTPFFK